MIKALSRPVFDVLALFYDRGSDFVSGVELSRYHRHCFDELLESGLLAPAMPLKHFEAEDLDGRPEPFFIQKSSDGILGHLCPDRGWVKIKDEERKHYRLFFEPLMGTVKATLDLKGQKHVAVEGLCFLGLCQFGKQKVEVYWSSCLSVGQSSSVKAFMNQRSVLQPAVVLHKSVQCCRYELGEFVLSLSLDALWSYEGMMDQWYFRRAIAHLAYQHVVGEEGFIWFGDTGTFVFPDQTTVTFNGPSGKMAVEYLIQRYRKNDPWVDQEYLMHEVVGVKSPRVQDVVKSVTNWKQVILAKGSRCRLNV